MLKKNSKIVLGTVRFSGVYGLPTIINYQTVRNQKIISYASKNNIRYLDTKLPIKKQIFF